MALIKCNNCGKDISSNAKKCVHCGATNETQESIMSVGNGTEKNINFFLKLSKICKIICFAFAGILMLIGLFGLLCGEFVVFLICLIPSITMVVIALLSTPFLEWKAYMLKQLYEINMKGGK
ncbi:MAG: hypothetical protein ACI32H_02930 [Bacilli bacterium]